MKWLVKYVDPLYLFSRFIITNTMLDFLVFLLDIPSLLADFSPRAKHKGESPYWRFMGLFLLTAELLFYFYGILRKARQLL